VQQIQLSAPDRSGTLRQRELEAGRVVLRAVLSLHPFLLRRAAALVDELEGAAVRRPLRRTLESAADGEDPAGMSAGLLGYGCLLERHAEYAEAERVYRVVLSLQPGSAATALHAARAARRAGRRDEALALYRQAGEHASGDEPMQLLARTGEALVAEAPELALTSVIAAARKAGLAHVVAIALEERAGVRIAERRVAAALRDLLVAAGRFNDSHDRVRVLHRLADLLTARGDLAAAREALLTALDLVHEAQRGHTIQRLRTVARAMGDSIELHRRRGQGNAGLVTLAPVRGRAGVAPAAAARRIRRLRDAFMHPGRTSA
jgi:tetratricopeptide (TPR) repeat protein